MVMVVIIQSIQQNLTYSFSIYSVFIIYCLNQTIL